MATLIVLLAACARAMDLEHDLASTLGDEALAHQIFSTLPAAHAEAFAALAAQAVRSGIDYKTLGLGWDHPQTRTAYRDVSGASFSCSASRQRQKRSLESLISLGKNITADGSARDATEAGLVSAFCTEIGRPQAAANAKFPAVAAALQGELTLPLRALSEGIVSMTRTFNGAPVPRAPIETIVSSIISHVLDGSFTDWRYTNPVGQRQASAHACLDLVPLVDSHANPPSQTTAPRETFILRARSDAALAFACRSLRGSRWSSMLYGGNRPRSCMAAALRRTRTARCAHHPPPTVHRSTPTAQRAPLTAHRSRPAARRSLPSVRLVHTPLPAPHTAHTRAPPPLAMMTTERMLATEA